MRLVFTGESHADVKVEPGELWLGSSDACPVQINAADWQPRQVRLTFDAKPGLWLHVQAGAGMVHVNARPVQECAMLRQGDVVTLGSVQFSVQPQNPSSIVQQLPPRSIEVETSTDSSAVRAVLRGVAGPFHGRVFPLVPGIELGSAKGSDIQIDGAGLAPHHSRLELQGTQIFLRARTAGQQVRLNGITVENAVLHQGDQISLGLHRFVVEAPGLPARDAEGALVRHRPITQIRTTVNHSDERSATADAAKGKKSGNLVWLLVAALLIAGALAALLIYAPTIQ